MAHVLTEARAFPTATPTKAGGGLFETFRARKHFGSLDGLRCLSILAVIWHHGPGMRSGWMLGRSGFLGVHLFFAISGFLITTLLLRERDRHGEISLRNFYLRRSLRIFPLYFAILCAYIAMVWLLNRDSAEGKTFLSTLGYYATYTSNWFLPHEGVIFGFAWSLAAEEQFYFFWPWIERYVGGLRSVLTMIGLVMLVLCRDLYWPVLFSGEPGLLYRIVSSVALPICLGVLLAHCLHRKAGFDVARVLIGQRWSSVFYLVLACGIIGAAGPFPATALAMTLLVGSCVIREDNWLARFLSLSLVVKIGVFSYGMYLMHGLAYNVLAIAGSGVPGLRRSVLEFALCVGLTFVAAMLSYRYYEGFFLNLKHRFER